MALDIFSQTLFFHPFCSNTSLLGFLTETLLICDFSLKNSLPIFAKITSLPRLFAQKLLFRDFRSKTSLSQFFTETLLFCFPAETLPPPPTICTNTSTALGEAKNNGRKMSIKLWKSTEKPLGSSYIKSSFIIFHAKILF